MSGGESWTAVARTFRSNPSININQDVLPTYETVTISFMRGLAQRAGYIQILYTGLRQRCIFSIGSNRGR
jgi:hypothetical protein